MLDPQTISYLADLAVLLSTIGGGVTVMIAGIRMGLRQFPFTSRTTNIVLCGAIGGMCPNSLNLAARLRSDQLLSWTALAGEALMLGIFAIVGATFVLIYKETNMGKALFLGASVPALIVSSIGALSPPAPSDPGRSSVERQQQELSMLEPAVFLYAVSRSGFEQEGRTLQVNENVPLSDIVIYVRQGAREMEATRNENGDWVVPEAGFQLILEATVFPEGVQIRTETIRVAEGPSPLLLNLRIGQTFWGGFLDAFGLDRRSRLLIGVQATIDELD